jgi:hypothetical protein
MIIRKSMKNKAFYSKEINKKVKEPKKTSYKWMRYSLVVSATLQQSRFKPIILPQKGGR